MGGAGTPSRRATALNRLADKEVDLLVVGGGATGAGIARDAALRGVSVALCEAGDFAGQTSSQSSKLIHGGLRYLQYGDFHLVFEGLTERRRLMAAAPHLCRPLEMLFPAYRDERPSLTTVGVGIAIYNALALWRAPARRQRLSRDAVLGVCPPLRAEGLAGAQLYIDCQTDDARLVLANVLDAERAGAAVASYVKVDRIARDRAGRARAAEVRDRETGTRFEVRARCVVNATGPFSDAFDRGRHNLRPTLGVHLVFDGARLPLGGRGLVLRSPRDGRIFFTLPAGRRTIVGTTDTDWSAPGHDGGPTLDDEIRGRRQDVDYLLEAARHFFPGAALTADDVIATYAGLRPLIAAPAHTASATSREHEIIREPDGVITVAGGKLTTFRRMAEEVVNLVAEELRNRGVERPIGPCVTRTRPLPGAGAPPALSTSAEHELAADVQRHLLDAYGSASAAVVAEMGEAPELGRRIDPELPYLWAEVVHGARQEHVREVEDALARRIPLMREARDQGLGAAERAGELIGRVLGWSAERRAASVASYRAAVAVTRRWRDDAPADR